MAEVINLRAMRKRKAKAEKDHEAATNRVRFGRHATEKRRESAETERAAREFEGKRIDRD